MVIKHCCLVLLGCLGLIRFVYGLQNTKSIPNTLCVQNKCSCCLETVICNISSGLCGDQCKDGYHGGRCKGNCPGNCVTCKDVYNPTNNQTLWNTANCTKCLSGYYSTTDYFQCQYECPVECEKCTSASDCTSCKPGYYLSDSACYQCPTGCVYCTSSRHCTQCKDRFYLSDDDSGYLICLACSSGCTNGECDNMTGICACKANFDGYKCNTCVNGRYGTECQYQCNSPCASCISFSECTSCKNEYILQGTTCQTCKTDCAECSSPDTCIQCKGGYYVAINGKDCTKCSTGCANKCNKSTGRCNCIAGFTGDKCCLNGAGCRTCSSDYTCSACVAGLHGENCDQKCPTNCAEQICDKLNGTCNTHAQMVFMATAAPLHQQELRPFLLFQ